jgi:hypothetical protein
LLGPIIFLHTANQPKLTLGFKSFVGIRIDFLKGYNASIPKNSKLSLKFEKKKNIGKL